MPMESLRERVYRANLDLATSQLVVLTWGNASGIDRDAGIMAIKPSGVPYDELGPDRMVLVSVEDGRVIDDGGLRPSSDTPTHLEIYRAAPAIGGVVHTHSPYATAWAQACRPIPCLGTTHADAFPGAVPVARPLTVDEIETAYEANTGRAIVESVAAEGVAIEATPGILFPWHGPFTWGRDAAAAVRAAVTLEEIARIAWLTEALRPDPTPIPEPLRARHYDRKHGPGATYGQPPDPVDPR